MYKIIAYLLIFLLMSLPSFVFAKSISLSVIEWAPFEGEKLEGQGIAIVLMTKVLNRIGFDNIRLKHLPWKRVLLMLKGGYLDVAPSVWYREDRGKYALFSNPYTLNQIRLFSLKSNGHSIKTQADLKRFSVGAFRGTAFINDIKAWAKEVQETSSTAKSIHKLKLNRIDAVMDDQTAFEYQAKDLIDLSEIQPSEYVYATEPLYAAFSRKMENVNKLQGISMWLWMQ
jgi:polar amino acid transport system substrate-binding protein